jgi:hypothetical protein
MRPRRLLTPSAPLISTLPAFHPARARLNPHTQLQAPCQPRGVCSVPGAQTWLVSVISRKRGSRSDLEPLSCVRVTCPSYRACVC